MGGAHHPLSLRERARVREETSGGRGISMAIVCAAKGRAALSPTGPRKAIAGEQEGGEIAETDLRKLAEELALLSK